MTANTIASETMQGVSTKQGYGVVFAATIGNLVNLTSCISATFGVFLIPIAESNHWQRAQVTTALSIIALISIFVYPIVGRLMDKFGGRKVLIIGNIAFSIAVALISLTANNLPLYYFVFALIGLTGAIPCTAMFSKMVSEWFDKNRGLMLGISAGLGNGLGSVIMPIFAAIFLSLWGWKVSYALIGLLIFAIGFPALLFFMKDAPAADKTITKDTKTVSANYDGLTLQEALKTRAFWLILCTIGIASGSLTAIFSHVIPVLTDRHMSLSLGTSVMSVLSLVTAATQILVGILLDRVSTPKIVAPLFLIAIAGLWLLNHGQTPFEVLLSGAFLGIGLGTGFGALPYFISRYFGLKSYGSIVGIIYSVVMLFQGITPYLMDLWFDHFKSYSGSLVAIEIVLGIVIAAVLFFFPQYSMKPTKSDEEAIA